MKTPKFIKAHLRETLLVLIDAVIVTVLYSFCYYISRAYTVFDSPIHAYLLDVYKRQA